jgi:phage shock protein C
MTTMERRLQKSRTDRMIDGVCGGIAAYFSIDATLVRIVWVLLTLFGGSGVILYIAAMIIMPKEELSPASASPASPPKNHDQNTKFWGILLVAVGAFWLMGNLGFPLWHHWWSFPWHIGVPLLLILAGVMFMFGGREYFAQQPSSPDQQPAQEGGATGPSGAAPFTSHRLYRSRTDKKILGVCGGIAAHLTVDPVIVRLSFVIGALASFGFAFLLYVVMGIVVPKEPATVVPVV